MRGRRSREVRRRCRFRSTSQRCCETSWKSWLIPLYRPRTGAKPPADDRARPEDLGPAPGGGDRAHRAPCLDVPGRCREGAPALARGRALGPRRPRRGPASRRALRAHGRARDLGRRRSPRRHPARRRRRRPDVGRRVRRAGRQAAGRGRVDRRAPRRGRRERTRQAQDARDRCSRAARCSSTSMRAAPRCSVPPRFRADPSLVLRFGYTCPRDCRPRRR